MEGLRIGQEYPCFVIAEIGQNHQGDVEVAKQLISLAKGCGADCVKFQKASLPHKFTQGALDEVYESPHAFGKTYGEHKAKLELSHEDFRELQTYARDVQILFTASAMDEPSADFLLELNVPFIKIGSGDTNNFSLIEHIARSRKPIVLSTGMADFETVKEAVRAIRKYHSDVALLHCVSAYPTPFEDVNLSVMQLYKEEFPELTIGYSGHEVGVSVSIAAVALGAKIIERHFTMDNSLKGTDHKCSLDPESFSRMIAGIREVERAIGVPIKKMLPSELPCQNKLGKSIVAARRIPENSVVSRNDLCIKVSRPKGVLPQQLHMIIGERARKDIPADTPIRFEDIDLHGSST